MLTAVRMALVHDPARGPFGAIPARVRIDRGLEFAAGAVHDAFAALGIDPRRMPAFCPHRKGKIGRVHRTIDQTLLCGLPGFTGGPRDAAGRLYGPLDDRFAARLRAAGDPVTPMPIEALAGLFGQWRTGTTRSGPMAGWTAAPRCKRGTTIPARCTASASAGCGTCCWPAANG